MTIASGDYHRQTSSKMMTELTHNLITDPDHNAVNETKESGSYEALPLLVAVVPQQSVDEDAPGFGDLRVKREKTSNT